MKAGPSERNQKGLCSESGKGVKSIFIVLLLVVLYSSLIFNLIYTFFFFFYFHFCNFSYLLFLDYRMLCFVHIENCSQCNDLDVLDMRHLFAGFLGFYLYTLLENMF